MNSFETMKDTLSIIQKAINIYKANLSDYNFTSSNTHKRLRIALSDKENIDQENVKKEVKILEDHLYEAFGNAFDRQMDYLFQMVGNKSSPKPRACIKVISESNSITTLYRYPEEFETGWETISGDDNTGFRRLLDGKDYFLCNNIPQYVRDRKYVNSRIDIDKVDLYFERKKDTSDVEHSYDKDWIDCWKNIANTNQRTKTYYKSTLVVPITIETASLSKDFIDSLKIQEQEKAILGFLCLDHPSVDFFLAEKDVYLCKIFADMLSLFLVQQINNTLRSDNYSVAMKVIRNMTIP
jgi:hypothetical protein